LTLALAHISLAQDIDPQDLDPEFIKMRVEMNRKTRPYTKRLPEISKIELFKRGAGMEETPVVASKVIEGQAARRIASAWRSQSWDYMHGGSCHHPAYDVKFFAGSKLILYASVCWECGNINFFTPNIGRLQGFISTNKSARLLLRLFSGSFPKSK
jgi:hypothetical protein